MGARRSHDAGQGARQARRILGIAMVLDGHSRDLSAKAAGMDRQTLCDWIHRYNAEGVSGLLDRPRPGHPARLTAEQMGELSGWVEQGPDLKDDGVVRWRCVDLRDKTAARFAIALHERSVGKLLDKLEFSSMSSRPLHPQSDLEAQETFKKRARIGGPPVAVETGCAILVRRGAAEKFLVDLTP